MFPLCLILGTALWILPEVGNILLWGGWFVAILIALIWTELNNRLALLRERSQMLGICSFASCLLAPMFLEWQPVGVVPLLLIGSFACFFTAIETKRTEGYVFYTFLLLACCILFVPQLIWLIPLYWWMTSMTLRTLNASNVSASGLGLLCPVAAHSIYLFSTSGWTSVQTFYNDLLSKSVDADVSYWLFLNQTNIQTLTPADWQFLVTAIVLAIMSLVSVVHFQHTLLDDKYHVRQAYQLLFVVLIALWACLLLFTNERHTLLILLLFCNAPFLAHYFTLAKGMVANIMFLLGLVAYTLTLIFNYNTEWILSLIFS
ncbi:MAG: hypothetical protein J6R79_07045 [Bacteroidaceae bacterium]|nr:hypothetical protein [Bacteroidaceae bacterium]